VTRILVVDDDAALRRALIRVLRAADVVAVASAEEALVALSEKPFDAVLTDYGLKPMDGVALLREVARAHPKLGRYLMSGFDPVTFTGHVGSGLILRVFPKPLDLDALRVEMMQRSG
jgi:DNA-binding NtrC family response regulator